MNRNDFLFKRGNTQKILNLRLSLLILFGFIVLNTFPQMVQAQGEITGVITDANSGEPLSGVSVIVQGASVGTTSDSKGRFSLRANSSDKLVFSIVGYHPEIIPVGDQTNLEVKLKNFEQQLDQVVVVGYGTLKKSDLTGAIATLSSKTFDNQPVTGVDQAIAGQVAGLQINTSNGIPGGGPQIMLRGLGAVGALNSPLYVVDGFPLSSTNDQISNPLNDIAPQDIASISILKDASATAIYGSRGANGVIMITTRSGTSGNNKVQVSAYGGFQKLPPRADPNLMDATEYATFKQQFFSDQILANTGQPATMDQIPEAYRNPEIYGKGTNWFKEITQTAPIYNFDASISGGNDKVQTRFSAGYMRQEGVVKTTSYERFTIRTKVDANLTDKLKVGFVLAPVYTRNGKMITGGSGRNGDGFGDAIAASPIPPVYNPDGTWNAMISEDPSTFSWPNPLMGLEEIDDHSKKMRILFTGFGQYSFANGLVLRSSVNADWSHQGRFYYRPSTLGHVLAPPPSVPSSNRWSDSYLDLVNENTLMYNKSFGENHLTALVGYSIQHTTIENYHFNGSEFPSDAIRNFEAAPRVVGDNSNQEWGLISYLGRVTYNYAEKYFLTATVRRDGSSRFGVNNLWGDFPSVAVAWDLSKENFMSGININQFKLRGSFGKSGNFQIGNYTQLGHVTSSNYNFNGTLSGGNILSSLGNSNLSWEKMQEFDVGLDLSFWNNRISITSDFYLRHTKDLLLQRELPLSSGYGGVIANTGNIRNVGFEFNISSLNISNSNFTWQTDFNFFLNRNKAIALGPNNTDILAGSSYEGNPTNITRVGYPVGMFFGFVVEGLYLTPEDLDKYPSFPGVVLGNMRVKDVNGDGMITDVQDFDIIGNPYPKFAFGITNTVQFKRLDLRISGNSQIGGHLIRSVDFTSHLLDALFNVSRDLKNRWRSPEIPGNGIIPTTNGSGYGRRMYRDANSLFVRNSSYFWIKNITLGYKVPIESNFLKSARAYFSVQNSILITSYPGNPEVTSYGGEGNLTLAPGFDSNPFPVPVTYTIGFNLNF